MLITVLVESFDRHLSNALKHTLVIEDLREQDDPRITPNSHATLDTQMA